MTMMTDPVFILFVVGANIVIAELLAKHTPAKHLGATLLVMVITAIVANLGVIPTSAKDAFREIGGLGVTLFLFASLTIAIHAVVTFATAALLRIDVNVAAIASQANIGGATTALSQKSRPTRSRLARRAGRLTGLRHRHVPGNRGRRVPVVIVG